MCVASGVSNTHEVQVREATTLRFSPFSALLLGSTLIGAIAPLGCAADKSDKTEKVPDGWFLHAQSNPNASAAYKWLDILLETSARSVDRVGARPTIISREMAIVVTSMFDAWAAYDDKAIGTQLGAKLRRPEAERTPANKETAIAYAVHRALCFVYPEDKAWIDEQMTKMGYDPKNESVDATTAIGVGNLAAQAVLDYRRNDGANQFGDENGSKGKPYSDYTYYESKNPKPDVINDPDRWQPIPFADGKGGKLLLNFLTPQWYRVKPMMLSRADQFRPTNGPPKVGSEELKKEVDECIQFNGHLTLEQKAVVEFMRDGPRSTGQSGHWLRFAEDLSRRDKYDLDQDVKLFFCVGNTAFDAFIACWDAKRFYDSSRPWTLVRYYYKGQKVMGYLGPCKGFGEIAAEEWHPYSPETFVTPPFPGYPSGHSTVSAACAKMLEKFSGSDRFECIERRRAGIMTEENCDSGRMQAVNGVLPQLAPGQEMIELKLPTFTATADLAGISRVMGGYHIQADNIDALKLGRQVTEFCWPRYQAYITGKLPAQ